MEAATVEEVRDVVTRALGLMERRRLELEAIAEASEGMLRREDVVAFARDNPDSACHSWFEWDETEAAERWRLHQAGQLIRISVTIMTVPDAEPVRVRAFQSLSGDRDKPGGGYRMTAHVFGAQDQREALVQTALGEFKALQHRWKYLHELSRIFDAIDASEAAA